MLRISRWTEKSGSYRTVQRFFAPDLPCMTISNELELVSKLRKDNLLYEFFRKLPAKAKQVS